MPLIVNPIATAVIGCAIRVHRALGPGLYESVYEQCLAYELQEAKLNFRRQVRLPSSTEERAVRRGSPQTSSSKTMCSWS